MKKTAAIILFCLGVLAGTSSAVEVTISATDPYVRTSGKPNVSTAEFSAYPGQGRLIIKNGSDAGENRTSSAKIILNDETIFRPSDFNQNVHLLEAPINLLENNAITVKLAGKPDSYITVAVIEDVDPPTVTLTSDSESISIGDSSTLTWECANADSCSITPDIGTVDVNGSTSVTPTETTTYTITATGLGRTASSTATVTVFYPPTVEISATDQNIVSGEVSTLFWTSTHAESATINQDIGEVEVVGSTSVAPTETTTYEITVTGPGGTATANTTLAVEQHSGPDPQPEGAFGEQYYDLIPSDATVDYYDEKRFSLITGLVRDPADAPIAGVSITMLDHPEYGTVTTDVQGRFSIPVEGGATLTVVYQTQGRITAHRNVYVPWNDTAIAETIQMIAEDPVSTTLTFNGNPDTVVTHRSTVVTDNFGSRSASMVFTGDNRAFLVDEYGNDVQELPTITTRATEYTTPESMPAELPPNSAYTYCVELSVDGAHRVRFAKPVIGWVDNFLGFDVGMAVPVGYYDRDRGVWVPSDNGIVVKLLDRDGDGVVDALDANGDDEPDDLNADNSFTDDVKGLDNPSRYAPGSTFWRFKISHFTPWDCNWPYGPPEDATPPNAEGIAVIEAATPEEPVNPPDEVKCLNSYVENRSRVFHEDISIPGTDLKLHYASDRVKGYHHLISVPASGDTVPASLRQIIVRVQIAGRVFEQLFEPLPSQKAEFFWDGTDHLGRPLLSQTEAKVDVGFVYDAVYLSAGNFAQSFAQAGDKVTGVRARGEITTWRKITLPINPAGAVLKSKIAEGWSISNHHSLNLLHGAVLFKGDGSQIHNGLVIIETFAGNGIAGYGGDGGPAVDAQLAYPSGVAADAAGNIYIADRSIHRVRKVNTDGVITTVAGNGTFGYSGDGGPAVDAQLAFPAGIALDAAGNLYIADRYNRHVRKVGTNGIITTVAGNGDAGSSGDGGPAVEAQLTFPHAVATDAAGNLYIADWYENRIRKVDASGIITTVAGNGIGGYSGDGGPAVDAQIYNGAEIVLDVAGNLYIADVNNNRIRKVDTSGIMSTVAGNGVRGYSGDGGPAVDAELYWPYSVAVDATGILYIPDYRNNRIRKVDTSGIITTVAGNGVGGYSGDGGPAVDAQIWAPVAVTLDAAADLYIADGSNHVIRRVSPVSAFKDRVTAGESPFVDDNGLSYIFSSSGVHDRTLETDSGVILRSFNYSDDTDLLSITDQFGNRVSIERDADSGVPTAIISPDGLRTELTIDIYNNLKQIIYPDGSYYRFEYTPDGLMTAEIDPEGNRFEHVFDMSGRLTDVLDEESGRWNYQRAVESNGNITTQITSALGNVTYYSDHTASTGEYSSIVTDPTGASTSFSRSTDGLTVNESLPCGMDLEFKYDVDSEYKFKYIKESSETAPSGLERQTLRAKTYEDTDADDALNLITETVTVNGKTTTLEHNTLQAQKTITSPEGRSVTSLYDPNTLLTESVSIPGLYDTTYAYDDRGRLISTNTDTRQTAFAYNSEGWLESITDPENLTTYYGYDAAGRITAITRSDNSFLDFTYDSNGNMTVLTNPAGIDHEFGYNKVNKDSFYTTPSSGSYSYVYDKDRRLIQTHFPSGQQIYNIYTNTQLTQVQTPEGTIDYTYLCGTKVDSISKGSETITYDYDGRLVTSETLGGTLNQIINYSYDNDFKLNSLTYAGDTSNYAYDNDGLMTGAGNFLITRNAQNGLPESVSGGAMNLSRVFNGYGEVQEQTLNVAGQNNASWSLVRDNNGRITHKTEMVNGVTAYYVYAYDSMGRLLTVNKDGDLVEAYQYDVDGTRIHEMNTLRGISGRELNYFEEDHLLSAGTTITYEYDPDGFLTTKTEGTHVTRFDYSSRGELLSVTLPDGTPIEYLHDPLGRRVAKKVDGTLVKKYLWQGMTRLLAVYDGTGHLLMRFEYADGRLPIAMTSSGDTYYLAYDQVGSLRLITYSSGNVMKLIEYDSFGNIITDTNPAFEVPFGFAGGLNDRDTELIRFGYRDYSPDVGRWTAKDPIFFAGGDTDLYGYVQNNPINWTDPQGLFRFSTGINEEGRVEEGVFRKLGRWLVYGPWGKCTLFPEKCQSEGKCGPSGGGTRG